MRGAMTVRGKPKSAVLSGTAVSLLAFILQFSVGCDSGGGASILESIDAELWQAMLAAEDMRAATAESMAPLYQGLRSSDSTIRRIAVRALGRLERPGLEASIKRLLTDSAAGVRAEAANALGQVVRGGRGSDVVDPLLARLEVESDPWVRGVICQTLGRLHYESRDTAVLVETALVGAVRGAEPGMLVGIARGLESWVRLNARTSAPAAETIAALNALAVYAPDSVAEQSTDYVARVRRQAVAALVRLGGAADLPQLALSDPDPQVRRLAVGAVAAIDSELRRAEAIELYLSDTSGMVRYAALQAFGRYLQSTRGCAPVQEALDDVDAHVALLAIDLMGNGCETPEEVVEILLPLASSLSREGDWHRPAHALVSLAKVSPIPAELLLPRFADHESWWVRVYAAEAASVTGQVAYLGRLAFDSDDNVRRAAIAALAQLKGHDADSIYIDQLVREDYQLVMTAAEALAGSERAPRAIPALLGALALITAEQQETSRDVRLALLRRLEDFGGPDQAQALRPYLRDFDPVVADKAAAMLTAWTGTRYAAAPSPLPAQPLPSHREIVELSHSHPLLVMRGLGGVELELWTFEAPINAARFARLAQAGYFDGLTFHRVVPGFVVQGGSPGANEYAGAGRYTRDELTMRSHLRGAVGVSTRGRDTGDAQIFINLVDNPRLDHDYTIFAEVIAGMDVVDRVLEGATIDRVAWR
jgi:cyclophilin family peptidyl-prolyl cis-trans isomerase/HEAT repeat protein